MRTCVCVCVCVTGSQIRLAEGFLQDLLVEMDPRGLRSLAAELGVPCTPDLARAVRVGGLLCLLLELGIVTSVDAVAF
jgi:hypothetical protein